MNFPTHFFILWPRWRAQEDSTKIVTVSTKDCRWATKTTDASIAPRRRCCVVGCHCLSPRPASPTHRPSARIPFPSNVFLHSYLSSCLVAYSCVLKMRFFVFAALTACAFAVPLSHPRELLQVYEAPTASAASNAYVMQLLPVFFCLRRFCFRYGSQLVRPIAEGVGKRDFSFNL